MTGVLIMTVLCADTHRRKKVSKDEAEAGLTQLQVKDTETTSLEPPEAGCSWH